MKEYREFLKKKILRENYIGFKVKEVHPILKPHQAAIVKWAIHGGRRAIFAAFGLGKTLMQLEICRQIYLHEGGKHLIICPLGVKQEFKRDFRLISGDDLFFVQKDRQITQEEGFFITNYESVRDGKIDVNQFKTVCLDEASVLRSYGSKTYQEFLNIFRDVKYRFVATATPSPNKYKELIHYAGFLGIMDTGQALTRFFQRDSTKANNLTLYPHKEKEFWQWLHSWAIFLQKPSDLGFDDEGYELPPLRIHLCEIKMPSQIDIEKNGQMKLFSLAGMSLQEAANIKRKTIQYRIEKMLEIIESKPNEHFIIWHDLEAERKAIKKALPEVVEVFGSQDLDIREKNIIDFSDGKIKYLATKPILSGSGCNFQRYCSNAIYLGIGFKFNDFIQSVHRIHRFQQNKECHIYIIYMDTEYDVLKTLMKKWEMHKTMVEKMQNIIKKYGLKNHELQQKMERSIGVKRVLIEGHRFKMVNNDCVEEMAHIDSNSVDLILTSIPFSNHYEYTPSYNDFGHTSNNDHFFEQMDFLTPELLRILSPGRIAAIHVKDRILFGNVTGYGMPSVDPFHSQCIQHYQKHGFIYMGMITVVTDVVRENNQTYRLGWTEQCKDGTKMGVGSPEYILLFRKLPSDTTTAYADIPVTKSKKEYSRSQWQIDAHAFWRSSGDRLLTKKELSILPIETISKIFSKTFLEKVYNYDIHVKIGEELDEMGRLPATFMLLAPPSNHPNVWTDISRMKTLNSTQSRKKKMLHICPANIDWVDRIINRYSNKNDLVLDPFAGIGTIPYRAVKMGRRGYGIELNAEYYKDACNYLIAADQEITTPTLFDVLEIEHETNSRTTQEV